MKSQNLSLRHIFKILNLGTVPLQLSPIGGYHEKLLLLDMFVPISFNSK